PAQAEEIRAPVGIRIEALPEPTRPRTDEQSADPAAERGRDLLAEGLEQILDRALEQLQRDVPGEAVRDDHVARPRDQVATLRVARKVQLARPEELMCLERELISLLGFLTDRQEPDLRIAHVQDFLCEHRSHVGEL